MTKLAESKISVYMDNKVLQTWEMVDEFTLDADIYAIFANSAIKTADTHFGKRGWDKIEIEELSSKTGRVQAFGRNIMITNNAKTMKK